MPIDKGEAKSWIVPDGQVQGALDGELVEAEQAGPKGRLGLPKARIVRRLGDPSAPGAVSLIAIHQHGIPDHFPDAAVAEADAAKPVTVKGRVDLRDLPLVTIDPPTRATATMRCWRSRNPTAVYPVGRDRRCGPLRAPAIGLDDEARRRGNPPISPTGSCRCCPDRLSGDLCSLHEGSRGR